MASTQQTLLMASGAGGDPYFNDVVFLLDVSGSTPQDKSGYASTVVPSSNAPVCSTAQSKWSGRSAVFTGVDCSAIAENAGLLDPGTAAYTVEAWVFVSSSVNRSLSLFGVSGPNYVEAGYSATARNLYANTASFGDQYNGFPSVQIAASTWTHIAVVKASGTVAPRIYMAGSYRGAFDTTSTLGTGQHGAGLGWFRDAVLSVGTFYMEDMRITLNQERYTGTGSYTEPDEAFPSS